MTKLALYRKHRPATFDDMLGQDLVVKILKESARQDQLSHAYLFSGPRGTGKTTAARIIAKIANCKTRHEKKEFKKEGQPCNKCESCLEIDTGHNFDIVEIDAASNRGIDEIRDLKENIRLAPSKSKFKVFIIDEAHMLTKDAFNALLKTLEEPPEYVILILATTELEKIPQTITSRAQKFFFKKASLKLIKKKLKAIADKESLKISDEALDLIAGSGEGSFRDAESLLDQVMVLNKEEIIVDDVEHITGRVSFNTLNKLTNLMLSGNVDNVLSDISDINNAGHDLASFTKDLIHHIRKVAVLSFGPEMENVLKNELIDEHLKSLKISSKKFEKKHLALISSLIEAYSQMRYSQFPIIPLEVALISSMGRANAAGS